MKKETSRQKLINVAKKLFSERGYEAVSVRDILKEVNGASGMFYHHFKSKDDIYQETMLQYINKTIADKRNIINSNDISFKEKLNQLKELLTENYLEFVSTFNPNEEKGSGNTAYMTVLFYKMLSQLSLDVSNMLEQAELSGEYFKKGKVIDVNNTVLSHCLLFGLWGVLYNDLDSSKNEEKINSLLPLTYQILGIEKVEDDEWQQ